MHPVLFNFFGLFNVHTYGLMIALGFMVGMQLDLSEEGGFDQFILDLTFWILIVAMIGSRLLFIIVEWEDDYSRDPFKIFKIWEGGLVFYGGFIASVLFSLWYSRQHKRDFFLVSDTLIPSVALGHFFGRIGCFAAGCCWGDPVSADYPFAVQFPPDSLAYNTMQKTGVIAYDAIATIHVHPTQLYESIGELMLFFFLLFVRTRKRFHGHVLLVYLFLYPLLRTSIEFVRGDKARGEYNFFGSTISTAQIISALIAVIALVTLAYLIRKKNQTA
jgi:phosphatidylglycerol:prolipoprotein diacylglycerol transferase